MDTHIPLRSKSYSKIRTTLRTKVIVHSCWFPLLGSEILALCFFYYSYRFEVKFLCYWHSISIHSIYITREIKGDFSFNNVYLAKEEILPFLLYNIREACWCWIRPMGAFSWSSICWLLSLVHTFVFRLGIYEARRWASMPLWPQCSCFTCVTQTVVEEGTWGWSMRVESSLSFCHPSSVWKTLVAVKEAGTVSFLEAPIEIQSPSLNPNSVADHLVKTLFPPCPHHL